MKRSKLKLVKFKTHLDNDKLSVIETLEEVLVQAKAGTIKSVAIAYVRPDGAIGNEASGTEDGFGSMLGSIALLQHRYMAGSGDED